MVRQLGCPTFFFTLSAAETKWAELLGILKTLVEKKQLTEQEIASLPDIPFLEKASLIRGDPITCARYFDHRFRAMFNTVFKAKEGPLGDIIDFFIRTEFQHRGSPHIHGLLWVKNAPVYDSEKEESAKEVSTFVDKYISCHVPPEGEPLHEEVKLQQHKHSHTCLKESGGKKVVDSTFPTFLCPKRWF